ncbi:MAG TPA: hypothetical protein VGN23_14545 [Verrucomicrobiae bacterium]|jgi:hypothetical protein
MNINKPITSALLALGLISAASMAYADSTVSIGGQSYAQVFITGSTAARGNVFNAVNTAHASGGVFDSVPTYVTAGLGAAPTGSTSAYTAYGTIGGTRYCLCLDFTGSEAGLWALEHTTTGAGIPNPVAANTLHGNTASPNAVIPGTPEPTGFIDPNSGNALTANADLAMADTSQAVSLSAPPTFAALHDYGIVGAVTFEWVKGKNSSPDGSWNHLANITDPEANILLGSTPQVADYFTGNVADQDDVYVVGRNKASGTHQNTMLDTLHGTTTGVNQWVVNSATYNGSGVLTVGTVESISSAGGISTVGNDGFDSGGNVASTLECDAAGYTDTFGFPVVMVGYLGISDANTAIGGGAAALTLNGVAENDETVENGTYSYWGHEHLYGTVSEDSAVQAIAQSLAGTTAIESFGSGTPTGALQAAGGLGGGEANPGSTQSSIISPEFMAADKPSGGDAGYASQIP